MNQLQVVTDLPQWVLALAEDVLVILATLTGHSVDLSSVRKAGDEDEQNGLDSADRE